MEKVIVKAEDDYNLSLHIFKIENAKAVVQIVHGMEEHQERYERFAKFLNENGYCVVSSNMRGHGEDAKDLGFFKDKNGYKFLISDQVKITDYIKQNFNNLPVYIFAHSMGTIITRVLLQQHSKDYAKVVLSGYPFYQSGAKAGIFVTNLVKAFKGAKFKSKFVEKLSTGAFNKKIENPRTNLDWLSSNEKNVDEYIADPLCGIGFTVSAYNDLFQLVVKMHQSKNYNNVNTEMPLLMLRGVNDPCTGGEKGALDSRQILQKAGFKNISFIDYTGMRHEILNELDYTKVQNDILTFFNNN